MNRKDIGYSLTSDDLKEFAKRTGLKIVVMLYKSLKQMSPSDFLRLLEQNDGIILLYPNGSYDDGRGDYRGHWVSLILHKNNKNKKTIEFFDPIARDDEGRQLKPDQELSWDHRQVNKPWLSKFLLSLPYEIEYNDHKMQRIAGGIATCGKHSLLRLLMKSIPLDSYYELIKKAAQHENESIDQWVNDTISQLL